MEGSRDTDRRALLALRCQRGEREAWQELVAEWERPLYYYLRRMSPSEESALGLLQEVWVRVFSSLGSLREPARLAPWLYSIARRTRVRQLEVDARVPDEMRDGEEVAAVDRGTALREDAEAVHAALARLGVHDREVLILFYLEDLALAEVAEVLDVPVGTVKSRLSHARARLRAQLERMQATDD